MVLEDAVVVVFADDWGVHPSSAQHLFRRFLGSNRVVWVNTIGQRLPRPTLRDARKLVRKAAAWARGRGRAAIATPAGGPEVADLALLPLAIGSPARRLNALLLRRAVRRLIGAAPQTAAGGVYVVSTLPLTADLALGSEATFAYYAVDDYAAWPGIDGRVVRAMDAAQAARADVVVAASTVLAARLAAARGSEVAYLPHGVDIGHFGRARGLRAPATEASVIFFGAIDERIDQVLFEEVARSRPDLRFWVVGPTDRLRSSLRGLANVRMEPPVAYADLPEVLARARVAFLPYVQTDLGRALSPLKAREALAAGLPVVATPVPELFALPEGVRLASRAEDLAAALDAALGGALPTPPLAALADDSWEARAEQMSRLLVAARAARAARVRA